MKSYVKIGLWDRDSFLDTESDKLKDEQEACPKN